MKLKFIIGVVGILSACGFTNAPSLDTTQEEQDNNWVIGPFHRPEELILSYHRNRQNFIVRCGNSK